MSSGRGNGATVDTTSKGERDDGAVPFVHLHVHTHYSLLDGATRIAALIERSKRLAMPAVAITDHGNLFGAIEFYQAAVRAGVKPIIGCETYIAPFNRRDKCVPPGGFDSAYHLLLLATDRTGYANLIKLATIGYLEGFYRKPRIDRDALREHAAGLVCTSACLGGEIPQALLRRDAREARRIAESYLEIFGAERFFIELQNQGIRKEEAGLVIDQAAINAELNDLARRLGVATVATNDVHYLEPDDVEAHDVLCCISTRATLGDPDRFRFDADQFYFKSAAEMAAALPEYPEALSNTLRVADLCNLELDFGRRYAPVYRPPAGRTAEDYLRELVYEGARRRYGAPGAELRERIDYELGVIADKGFSGYFLIVWDIVRWCAEQGIPCQARGSGCSTVVGYCLRISQVDPLRYGLYFERFMDPERDEMPDIDLDICQDGRPRVIEYVRGKYGHVAQIITFGTLKARAAIRDVCRVLGISLAEADRVAKLVPEELHVTLDKALRDEPELRRLYDADPQWRRVLDIGRRLEGLARHASVHAAGVVIADVPLDSLIPLYKPADADDVITQFDGPTVEKVGLLKMDFLGLRTLSQIHLARELIRVHHGLEVDLEALDLNDPRVYELLASGQTQGVFQFESGGMRDVLMKMKPNRIEDLIAANALFRPGPMQYINEYVARKHGRVQWSAPHPLMAEVLDETYGIMVYQEQVSRLVHRLGGVPLRRAFRLAKAISKKKKEMIDAERQPFIEGCAANGLRRSAAEQVFEDVLRFGGYAFNKAHSAGYALLAFQTAYLKTYFPVEFMAALMTYESGDSDKLAGYLHECRTVRQRDGSIGIDVNPPDVNASQMGFTVVYPPRDVAADPRSVSGDRTLGAPPVAAPGPAPTDPPPRGRGRILFGLTAISGLGEKAVRAILEARESGGPFRDIYDFCERVDLSIVNRSALEALIKAGAFDSTGAMRRALMEVLPRAMEHGQTAQRDRRAGQMSMFGGAGVAVPPPPIPSSEWNEAELLLHEKQALGFYITRHPLTQHLDAIRRFGTADTARVREFAERLDRGGAGESGRNGSAKVVIGGLISRVRNVPIRTGRSAGRKMAVVTLEDLVGSIEAIVFPDDLERIQPLLRPDSIVFVSGQIDVRREEPCIRVERITPLADARRELARHVVVELTAADGAQRRMAALRELCRAHRGRCPLYLRISTDDGWIATVESGGAASVDPSDEFLARAQALAGRDKVRCVGPRNATPRG